MTLFFETNRQAVCFLAAVPLGFLLAAFLCCGHASSFWRLILDVLLFLVAGVLAVALVALLQDSAIRLYHLLGAFCGALLYMSFCHSLRCVFQKWKALQKTKGAGRNPANEKRIDIPQ